VPRFRREARIHQHAPAAWLVVAPYFSGAPARAKLPTKANRILNRIKEAREGKMNSSVFGERMRGKGQYWEATERLFEFIVNG
jgi:hypothetical protein